MFAIVVVSVFVLVFVFVFASVLVVASVFAFVFFLFGCLQRYCNLDVLTGLFRAYPAHTHAHTTSRP